MRALILVFIASLLSFAALPVAAPIALLAQDGGQLSGDAQTVLQSVNQARADAGLPPLQLNPLLTQAAQNHVNDVVDNRIWGHIGSDGSTVGVRAARAGYSNSGGVSENWVAASGPGGAIAWWMNDYIHRVNILTPKWTEVGVGVRSAPGSSMTLYVTVFGAGNGGSVAAAPAAAAPVAPPAGAPAARAAAPSSVPVGGMDYTIQPGDTLLGIGVRYGIDWQQIASANGLSETSLLQIGQSVRLPDSEGRTSADQAAPVATAGQFRSYMVFGGDTLLSIAARYSITWEEVAAANGLGEHDILQVGQILRIPIYEAPATDEVPGAAPAAPQAEPQGEGDEGEEEGEASAADEGQAAAAAPVATPVATLTAQTTFVSNPAPAAPAQPAPAPTSAIRLHTVQPGETVISIAVRYGLNWQTLLDLNGLSDDSLLQIGQQIRLE